MGMRFREQPSELSHVRIATGSPADGTAIGDLDLGEGVWISLVNRDGNALPANRTVLAAGDEVLSLVDSDADRARLAAVFGGTTT